MTCMVVGVVSLEGRGGTSLLEEGSGICCRATGRMSLGGRCGTSGFVCD